MQKQQSDVFHGHESTAGEHRVPARLRVRAAVQLRQPRSRNAMVALVTTDRDAEGVLEDGLPELQPLPSRLGVDGWQPDPVWSIRVAEGVNRVAEATRDRREDRNRHPVEGGQFGGNTCANEPQPTRGTARVSGVHDGFPSLDGGSARRHGHASPRSNVRSNHVACWARLSRRVVGRSRAVLGLVLGCRRTCGRSPATWRVTRNEAPEAERGVEVHVCRSSVGFGSIGAGPAVLDDGPR